MLNRNFDISNISSTINDVKASSGDLYNNVKETLSKKVGFNTKKSQDPLTKEIGQKIEELCSSNRLSRNDQDWLNNLNRGINGTNRLELCSTAKKTMGEGDTLLMVMSKIRGGGSIDSSGIVSNFVSSELNALGFKGTVPGCLLDSLTSKLGGLFSLPGGLIPKLDMSKILSNKCLKDSINSGIGNLNGLMKGTMVNTMMGTGNGDMAKDYMKSMYLENPLDAKNLLESNLSASNSKGTIEQFNMLNTFNADSGAIGNIDKSRLLGNINSEVGNNTSIFKGLDNYYNSNDLVHFNNNSNLSKAAKIEISTRKSTDDIKSPNKVTSLNSASLSAIAGLF